MLAKIHGPFPRRVDTPFLSVDETKQTVFRFLCVKQWADVVDEGNADDERNESLIWLTSKIMHTDLLTRGVVAATNKMSRLPYHGFESPVQKKRAARERSSRRVLLFFFGSELNGRTGLGG